VRPGRDYGDSRVHIQTEDPGRGSGSSTKSGRFFPQFRGTKRNEWAPRRPRWEGRREASKQSGARTHYRTNVLSIQGSVSQGLRSCRAEASLPDSRLTSAGCTAVLARAPGWQARGSSQGETGRAIDPCGNAPIIAGQIHTL
jgi:hypothetical protein